MKHLVAPSILAADFLRLKEEIELVNTSKADWLHIDVMDGHFVPNISFGLALMPFFKKASQKPLDVHLMIEEPSRYVDEFVDGGADVISVHLEACRNLHRTIQMIKGRGIKAGVAINPHSPVDLLEDVLEDIDIVCLMSVNPGYGGQKFIYRSLDKIRRLKQSIIERNLETLIEVDGGVGLENAEAVLQAGADVLVAGSSVFKSDDPKDSIRRLKSIGEI